MTIENKGEPVCKHPIERRVNIGIQEGLTVRLMLWNCLNCKTTGSTVIKGDA